MEQAGQHRLADGQLVDGEPGELADLAAFLAQDVDLVLVELIGRQALLGIEPDADRADELALVVGDEAEQVRVALLLRLFDETGSVTLSNDAPTKAGNETDAH